MAATPVPTTTIQVPGTVNPMAHAATWGTSKVHQVVQARQKAVAQQKAKAQPKASGKSTLKTAPSKNNNKSMTATKNKSSSTTSTRTTTKGGEKPWYEQNHAQLHHMIEKSVQGQAAEEELAPKQRLAELAASKAAGEGALKANTASTTQALGNLGAGQEASAKTIENEDAERAKQQIANLGTGAQGTSPGVNNAEAQFLASTGASGVAAAQGRNESEAKYLASVTAAANLRGAEQVGSYANKVTGEEGTENTKLAGIKAAQPGQISAEELKLLPEQTKLRLAAGELGVKQQTAQTTKTNDETKNRITSTNDRTRNALTAQGNQIKNREVNRRERETASQEAYRTADAAEKAVKARKAQAELPLKLKEIEAKTAKLTTGANGSKVTSEQQIAISEITKATAVVKMLKEAGNKTAELKQALITGGSTKTLGFSLKGLKNGLWATAAVEIVEKGELDPKTKKALETAQQLPQGFALSNYALGEGNR